MKKLIWALALVMSLLVSTAALAADIEITPEHFLDDVFREYVKRYDTDQSGTFSTDEINAVTDIDCNGERWTKKNKSLKGIEFFTELTWLNCYDNELTELDVSQNSKLENLYLDINRLTKLDVSKNGALYNLTCSHNQLETLNIGNQPDLVWLMCSDNKLTKLDLSQAPELITLHCSDNPLTALDVSHNPKLNALYCFNTPLTALDLSHNTLLCALYCFDTQLTELDVSQNGILSYLDCQGLGLTKLDVSHNPELWELNCSDNALTELDLSQNAELEELDCTDNQLACVNTNSRALRSFAASNNVRTIFASADGVFDLSTLNGFDVQKAGSWKGGTISGSTLRIAQGAKQVTYTYDCGSGKSVVFTFNVTYLPQTGDGANLTLWLALLGGCGAALALMMRRRKA